jgi:NAD(P)-dependent dehydrogenase (short-subunit alcohol dehydrogenase family)
MKYGQVRSFIQNQFCEKPRKTPEGIDLRGSIAIVTGSSSGLGLESSRQLLALGLSHLILAVRSEERGKAVASQLQSANPAAKIDVWLLDMESYKSVQDFALRCESELSRIDIVILNAGIAEMDFDIVPSSGHERVMQVNYYSTMLLTVLLLPILKAKVTTGMPAHITVVSSLMASFASFPNRSKRPLLSSFDDTSITPWDPVERYSTSKLLLQMFLTRLVEGVPAEVVTINMVEPGLTKTNLFRKSRGLVGAMFDIMAFTSARTVEAGALTYIDAAVVKGTESHGSLLVNCRIAP